MKKMLLVMNPFAGQKRANRVLPEILTLFNRADYQVDVYMTAGPGDGARVVAQRAGGVDVVTCIGGDGTLNETVSGLLQSGANVPIGYIPAGSTNDFAASLGIPGKILKAAEAIVEGTPVPIDVGQFGERYFSYVASFGAFTKTSYTTPQNVKNALGHTAYLLEGISELNQLRKCHVSFALDEETVEDDFIFGAISNSTSVGGVLTLDPSQVDLADGKLELLLVRIPRDFFELQECIQALRSQKYDCAAITFRSASHIEVKADRSMDWTLDGERCEGREQVTVRNLHHAIQLLIKEEG